MKWKIPIVDGPHAGQVHEIEQPLPPMMIELKMAIEHQGEPGWYRAVHYYLQTHRVPLANGKLDIYTYSRKDQEGEPVNKL